MGVVRSGCWVWLLALGVSCTGDDRSEALRALDGMSTTAPEHPASFVEALKVAVLESRPVVVWKALPGSYRSDVQALIRDFGQRMDQESWDQGMRVMQKFARLLQEKDQFLLETPLVQGLMAAQAPDAPDMTEALARWGSMLGSIADSEVGDLARLREMDVGAFLEGAGAGLVQQLMSYGEMLMGSDLAVTMQKIESMRVTVKDLDGTLALVEVTAEGESPSEEVFAQVEGCWVPRSMADQWADDMVTLRGLVAQVGDEEGRAANRQLLATVEESLDQMLAAANAGELQTLLNKVVFQVGFWAAGRTQGSALPEGG